MDTSIEKAQNNSSQAGVTNSRELRNAFGSFMTGVTIVTTMTKDNTPIGFTANSFTSVSLDPPLLLVCLANRLSSYDVFKSCQNFAVNILSEEQKSLSNIFASVSEDRFSNINWQKDMHGCPVFNDCLSTFSCLKHEFIQAGDHGILIGKVIDFLSQDNIGLGYVRGNYFTLSMERKATEAIAYHDENEVGAIIENNGKVMICQLNEGYVLPTVKAKKGQSPSELIKTYLKQNHISHALGQVYSVFENKSTGRNHVYIRAIAENDDVIDGFEYRPISEITTLTFTIKGVDAMMGRFIHETENGVFRLYVGNEQSGDIHDVNKEV